MDDADLDKTVFTTLHYGLFRLSGMPFGLRDAPGSIQGKLEVILSSLKWRLFIVYIDEIFICSRNADGHILHVRPSVSLLYNDEVILDLLKCHFFTKKMYYFGHVIHASKMALSEHTTDSFLDLKPACNETELKYFLGLCNENWQFVFNFA